MDSETQLFEELSRGNARGNGSPLIAPGSVSLQGGYNAATNTPDLDTAPVGILKGYTYYVTAAGPFFTENMEIGDVIIANVDNPASLSDWTRIQFNINSSVFKIDAVGILHVSNGNPNSTDSRSGISNYSMNQPFVTIQEAINAALSGEVVIIHSGSYNESITVKSDIKLHAMSNVTITSSTTTSTIKGVGVTNFQMTGYAEVIFDKASFNEACFEFTTASNVHIEVQRAENKSDAFGVLKITGGTTMNFFAHKEAVVNYDGTAQYCAYIENSDLNYYSPVTIKNTRGNSNTLNPAFRVGGTLTANRKIYVKTNYKWVPKATSTQGTTPVFGSNGGNGASYATAGFTLEFVFDGDIECNRIVNRVTDNGDNPVAMGTKCIFRNGRHTLTSGQSSGVPAIWLENIEIEFQDYVVNSYDGCIDVNTSNGAIMRAVNTRFYAGRSGGGVTTSPIATVTNSWAGANILLVHCMLENGLTNTNNIAFDSSLSAVFTGLKVNHTYCEPSRITKMFKNDGYLFNGENNAINYPISANPTIVNRQNYLCFSENFDNVDGLLTPINQIGRWSNQSSLVTSIVSNNAASPSGLRKAYTITVSGNGIIFRQKTAANFTLNADYTISGWIRRVSGDGNINFDLADGANTNPIITLTTGVWTFFSRTIKAGTGDFLDFNMQSATGATVFDITEFQLNDGTTHLEYTRTMSNRVANMFTGQRPRNAEIGELFQQQITQELQSRTVTANNYTLTNADHGRTIRLSNGATAYTVTVPAGLRSDFSCKVVQYSAGQATFTASGTTLLNADGFFKTEKQYVGVSVNQTTSNSFLIEGRLVP